MKLRDRGNHTKYYWPFPCKPIHAVSQYYNGLVERSPPQRGNVR